MTAHYLQDRARRDGRVDYFKCERRDIGNKEIVVISHTAIDGAGKEEEMSALSVETDIVRELTDVVLAVAGRPEAK